MLAAELWGIFWVFGVVWALPTSVRTASKRGSALHFLIFWQKYQF